MAEMTPEQIHAEFDRVRREMQTRVCCTAHAIEISLRLASYATLVHANYNAHQAAATLLKVARLAAEDIRKGKFRVVQPNASSIKQ